jgi:hypothetical protein
MVLGVARCLPRYGQLFPMASYFKCCKMVTGFWRCQSSIDIFSDVSWSWVWLDAFFSQVPNPDARLDELV